MATSDHHHGDGDGKGQHGFDERAATWDDDPAKVERAARVADAIRRVVPLDRSTRMLDYGAGTGLVTQAMQDAVGPVTLADTSAGMREVIERKIAEGDLPPDARVWDVDLSAGSVPGERFDLVVTLLALHHIHDVEAALANIAGLLDDGGHLCIVDLEREDGSFHGDGFDGHHGFATDELTAQLVGAGFSEVEFRPCDHIVRDGRTYPLFLATSARRG